MILDRETMILRMQNYVRCALDGDAGDLEESVPGDLDGLLEDLRIWIENDTDTCSPAILADREKGTHHE